MPRISDLVPEQMTDEQREVAANIAAGPRGEVRGPFKVLLHSPKLAECVQRTGAYVRFDSVVPWKLRELAILITAHHWSSQYEWYAHEKEARRAGLDEGIIEAVRHGRRPDFTEDAEQEIWTFCTELYATRRVSEPTYRRIVARHGQQGAIDLCGLLGHYNLIALTLNTFEVPVPEGPPPLAE